MRFRSRCKIGQQRISRIDLTGCPLQVRVTTTTYMICRGANRTRRATRGSTEPYYFPNVSAGYRPTSRLFLRLSGFVPPSRRPSPKCAKSAGLSPIGLPRRHVGGTGSKKSYRTNEFRTTSLHCAKDEAFLSARVPSIEGESARAVGLRSGDYSTAAR